MAFHRRKSARRSTSGEDDSHETGATEAEFEANGVGSHGLTSLLNCAARDLFGDDYEGAMKQVIEESAEMSGYLIIALADFDLAFWLRNRQDAADIR